MTNADLTDHQASQLARFRSVLEDIALQHLTTEVAKEGGDIEFAYDAIIKYAREALS